MQLLPRLAQALRRVHQHLVGLFVGIDRTLVRFAFPVCRQMVNGRRLRLAGMRMAVFREGMLTHQRYRRIISIQKYIA
jgi:hypothetical protein